MKLYNNGKALMGMVEVTDEELYHAQKNSGVNAMLSEKGFNPYHGYYTLRKHQRCTTLFVTK